MAVIAGRRPVTPTPPNGERVCLGTGYTVTCRGGGGGGNGGDGKATVVVVNSVIRVPVFETDRQPLRVVANGFFFAVCSFVFLFFSYFKCVRVVNFLGCFVSLELRNARIVSKLVQLDHCDVLARISCPRSRCMNGCLGISRSDDDYYYHDCCRHIGVVVAGRRRQQQGGRVVERSDVPPMVESVLDVRRPGKILQTTVRSGEKIAVIFVSIWRRR